MSDMSKAAGSKVRGFIYWILTAGPIGVFAGTLLKGRVFDRFGPIAVPQKTKPDTIGAIVFGVYEYPERVLIEHWLPSDVDCIELGCSIGVISRVILKKLRADKRLTGVEASAPLLDLAKRNIAAAGFSARFNPVWGAVHYGSDSVAFAENADHIRGSVAVESTAGHTTVPCVTLAEAVAGLSAPFSLVMDVEGSEFDVVANDSGSLANCRVIIAEVHGDTTRKAEFVEALNRGGFDLAETKHSVSAFVRRTGEGA